jgi:cytochrome c-type biogenesis protein CcmH/NrfG
MRIQKESNSYAQSPYVEFTLYQTYIAQENFEKALEVLLTLENVELSNNNRARQKYLLGTVYAKLWREGDATKSYDEAIKIDPNSSWAKLAASAKEI